jgi:hypothetical protein
MLRLRGSKMGAKLAPIGQAAIEVFEAIPRLKDNPHVITRQVKGGYLTDIQRR